MPGRMRTERAEALTLQNNDMTRFAEAEHVGILAAETYFPAQYVSIFVTPCSEIKTNTFCFCFMSPLLPSLLIFISLFSHLAFAIGPPRRP